MNWLIKHRWLIILIYLVSPIDVLPGPIDDIILLLVGTGGESARWLYWLVTNKSKKRQAV